MRNAYKLLLLFIVSVALSTLEPKVSDQNQRYFRIRDQTYLARILENSGEIKELLGLPATHSVLDLKIKRDGNSYKFYKVDTTSSQLGEYIGRIDRNPHEPGDPDEVFKMTEGV